MPFGPIIWIVIILGGWIIYARWSAPRTQWPIKIVVDHFEVTEHQGLPRAKVASIVNFFEGEIDIEERIVVRAILCPNGQLRTKVFGAIDPETKQRMRNFLVSEL